MTDGMAMRTPYRGTLSALLSAAIHAAVLITLAATSFRIASEDRSIIPLVILNPAPPPPPPGAPAAAPAAVVAPVEPPKPVEMPAPTIQPKSIVKPKIAAQPKPKLQAAAPRPTPATTSPATTEMAAAPPAANPAGAAGIVGGVRGGEPGGVVGGRRGGTGDEVWRADQVAVPPSVVETVRPQYPPVARARGQEGIVVVQAIIDRDGEVEPDALRVVQSQPPFDDAALAAFRRWKFRPGRDESGQLVRVIVEQPMRFQLR